MKVFAYADETEFFLKDSNVSIIGSGILITEREIEQTVIDSALSALKAESNHDKNDLKTLKNEYFHASSDSANAHWHLCNAINNDIQGYFKYSYHNQSLSKKNYSIEDLNKRTLELVSTPLVDYKFDEVTLIIEERPQFKQKQSELWIENLYRILEITLYQQTSFITYFPKINIKTKNKTNPGLQIVDFILWAQNRTQNGDSRWINKLKLVKDASYTSDNSPSYGGSFYVNKRIEFPLDRFTYPFQKSENTDHNDVIRSYLLMEQSVLILYKYLDNLPKSIRHFKPTLKNTAEMLIGANQSLYTELFDKVASIYLRIFDTLPLYANIKDEDKGSWEVLLFSKHIAALFRRKGYGNNIRTINSISYWKYHTPEIDYRSGLIPIQEFITSTIENLIGPEVSLGK